MVDPEVHVYGNGYTCATNSRGYPTPENRSPAELVLDAWSFEVAMRDSDRCSTSGCTLASAFVPEAGRHELVLYPKMFTQSRKEQVDTFIHEIGHVFGLRHFFANIAERRWPSVIFGTHRPFSIMNYGHNSELTEDDRSDLRLLYNKVWNNELVEINRPRIVLVRPFHDLVLTAAFS